MASLNDKETTGATTINKKILDTLGAKKEEVCKTIFRLAPEWESFLRKLAKTSNLTIRDFLDSLADIAKKAYSDGTLPRTSEPAEGKRMSYAISKNAKESFTELSALCGVSRDSIIQNALAYILSEFKKNALSPKEKIKYAKILDEAFHKISNIYYSDSVKEAREKLCAAGDPDFAECEKKFYYIEQFKEVYLQEYIKTKQAEIEEKSK